MASCINSALHQEIVWPNGAQRRSFASVLTEFPGCIRYIDGTLTPTEIKDVIYYNGHKKIYSFNNVAVMDHDGLFVFVDTSYIGSFNDINFLRASRLYKKWRLYFDERRYLLEDPGNIGADFIILRCFHSRENPQRHPFLNAFNKMHFSKRIKLDWGIGDLKLKFPLCSGKFKLENWKFVFIFESCAK